MMDTAYPHTYALACRVGIRGAGNGYARERGQDDHGGPRTDSLGQKLAEGDRLVWTHGMCGLRTVMHGFERLGGIADTDTVVVQGAGPVQGVRDLTAGRGAEIVLEMSGIPSAFRASVLTGASDVKARRPPRCPRAPGYA